MHKVPTHIAYVAFGSNLGDKSYHCAEAIRFLHAHPKCKVLKVSSLYETEPLNLPGDKENPWFINGVLKLQTQLNPVRLLNLLRDIELKMGRDPEDQRKKWSPRVMDLDIIFFDHEIRKSKPLTIPHPEMHLRRFVLEPLKEIAADFVHPIQGKSVRQLLKDLHDSKKVVPLFKIYLKKALKDPS